MRYWLMKTEPDECSIDDALAAPRHITPWTGVRVLFYHSSCDEPGIAGLAEVASAAYPDPTQFERSSPYYDPKAKKDDPRWFHVEVRALSKTRLLPLAELRKHKPLAKMVLLRPGNRLSITPVTAGEWTYIGKLV